MIFTSIPTFNEKVFTLRANGGYYDGLPGKVQLCEGSSLNNCTAAAWGLMALYEENMNCRIGCGSRTKNQPYDAGLWWTNSPTYTKTDFAVEGSVAVYEKHVVFINEVKENGDAIAIESAYGSKSKKGLWTRTLKKENNYEISTAGNLLGFLVGTKFVPEVTNDITTEQAITKMAQDVLKGMYGNGTRRKDSLYKAIQDKVNQLYKEK